MLTIDSEAQDYGTFGTDGATRADHEPHARAA